MKPRAFADSNILLYCFDAPTRAARARKALASTEVISAQVLNEFANVARRKLQMSVADIRLAEDELSAGLEILPLTKATHLQALDVAERYGFSFYDSLIVAAALQAGCHTLFTEDLQHGQVIEDRLHVQNPFL